MSVVVIYDSSSRAILTINPPTDGNQHPILPVGVENAVATTLSDAEAAKFATPGARFALDADGKTVVVTAAPTDDVAADRASALSDLQANYQAAMTRLDDIVTNGSTYTNVQVRDAVIDEARILRRALHVVRSGLY